MEEFVFIHDTGFTIKILAPGVDPFEIQVLFLPNSQGQTTAKLNFLSVST